MLEKYFALNNFEAEKSRLPTNSKETIIAPMSLSDDRKRVTTNRETLKLSSIVLVHNLSNYRRKVSNELLPEINIAIDILLNKEGDMH